MKINIQQHLAEDRLKSYDKMHVPKLPFLLIRNCMNSLMEYQWDFL